MYDPLIYVCFADIPKCNEAVAELKDDHYVMSFKQTARRAVIITGIIATVAAATLTTPDPVTQLAVFVTAILVSSLALFVVSRSRWFQSASPGQQARRIWLASSASSFIVWAIFWIPMITRR